MSKIKKNPLFIPLNFKLEIKKYMNGYIIWSSGFINCFKTKSNTSFSLKKKEHTLNLYSKTAYLNYYFLQNNNLKRKSTQKTSVLYWELKQNIISLLVGYKKILSAQGTEYEFKLEKNSGILYSIPVL